MGIGHYEFWAEILMSFLDIWIKIIKKNQAIWIKGKNNKSHTSWQKNQCLGKKKRKGSVLVVLARNLFYNWCLFIPILVLKLQLKVIVKTSAKTRGFLSLFLYIVFLLYSRVILGFSLSPSLLLCAFHCFNCWIILENLSC